MNTHFFFSRVFCGLLLCLAGVITTTAHAATFNVTSNLCTGAGSLQAAITAANTNPGPDVISFASGLEVDVGACPDGPDGSEGYFADVTDDVTFEGNGAKLMGHISWVTAGGLVTPLNKCPATQSGTIIVAKTAGFLSVAGGKSVVVKNLSVREVHGIAYVGNNASLVLEDFTAERVLPFSNCAASALEAGGNANLTLRRNHWDTVVSWPPFILPPISVFPAIVGEDVGNLVIEDSFFFRLVHGDARSGLLYWAAPAGKTIKIVSTRMDGTGGIVAQGGVDTFIVNSAWVNDSFSSYASVTERIVNASTGTMKIVGSTIMAGGVDCDDGCQPNPGAGIPDSNGLIRALSGRIDLVESAIGVNLPSDQGKVLSEEGQIGYPGGDIRADARTWIQPDVQTAAELKSITNQPGLLTEAPGLARFEPVTEFVPFVSPLLGTGGNPGKLIDVIPDATCGGANKLLNPIDGSCITTDVFGNSRWDTGNNKRNIGAVQLTLSPHLAAVDIASNAVQLSWSRPQDPVSGVITGYAVFYRPTGTADPFTRVDIAGAATLSAWITGLTNGTVYDFKAVAVNGVGDGPDSSVVTAVPFGVIQAPVLTTPTAGDGQVKLDWSVPDSGGYTITGYHVFFRQQGTAQWVAYQTVTALTDTVYGLVNGVAYEFAVSTATSSGESSLSTPVLATPSGPAAVPLFVTPGNASVMLGWNPAAAVNAAFYRIEYRPHNLLAWTQLPKQAAGPVTQLVSGLINQQLYDFRVMVLDSGDQIIATSNIASATPGLQTILGSKMVVKNPGNNPLKRSVILRSKDKQHLDELFGDPTVTGAELTVIANGENGSSQVFTLPASGWKAVQHGYRYHDNKGINGPVKHVRITVKRKGAFIINADITGKHGTVDVVPPNPGIDGGFILDFSSSGRYCVLFDGNTIQKDSYEELWRISKPLVRGCPVARP